MLQHLPQQPTDPRQPCSSETTDVLTTEALELPVIENLGPRPTLPPQRRTRFLNSRVNLSCDLCHRRKIKCDARQPSCANCQNIGAQCQTLRTVGKRGRKTKSRQLDVEVSSLPVRTESLLLPSNASLTEAQQVAVGNLHLEPRLQPTQVPCVHPPHLRTPQQGKPFGLNVRGSLRISCFSPYSENDQLQIWQDLAKDLTAADIHTESVIAYMTTCVGLFSDNIYPIYPIIYKSNISRTLVELQNSGEQAWDIKSFMLLAVICAYTLAVLPASVSGASWPASQAFYRAFKKAQDVYAFKDTECPSSSSVIIHLIHAAWLHVSGSPSASWYVLGEAMRTALLMRLHDEKTYEAMDYIESELCRRAFWALYTGDKASSMLGGHLSTFNNSIFWGVTAPQYPKELGPEDQATVTQHNGRQQNISILVGFNANQDLWRSAENLLLAGRDRETGDLAISDPRPHHLATAYHKFLTILDDLPSVLRFHNSVDTTLEGFYFTEQGDHRPHVAQALATQRANLQISYQYLKLFFLQKYPFLYPNGPLALPAFPEIPSGSYSRTSFSPSDTITVSPTSPQPSHYYEQGQQQTQRQQCQESLRTRLVRQTLQIAEDMLYVIHTSGIETLRLNGEPCAEKIRRVAASVLEVIAQDIIDVALLERAVLFRDLYPHLLARLESKASDNPDSAIARSFTLGHIPVAENRLELSCKERLAPE